MYSVKHTQTKMAYFEDMTEEEILNDAMKAVSDYLERIRQTGQFDLDRCVDLELKRVEYLFKHRRNRPVRPNLPRRLFVKKDEDIARKEIQALDAVLAHFKGPLTERTKPIQLRYIQGRKISSINAVSAKAIITPKLKAAGFDGLVIGQRYRARVEVPVTKTNQIRFYVPYKDLNWDEKLDEMIGSIRQLQELLEKLGTGAVIEKC